MSRKRPAAPPPRIDGFNYVRVLGSGGFADVYLYQQDRPRRQVAVKVLHAGLKTEGARRAFESEANLMAQLSTHPYIVTIYEADITPDGHSYLAMEYCSRPSLDLRYRKERFRLQEALAIGIQVASAVETAHRAGIAHRDIKPANILVTDYNRPALTDFGISGIIGGDPEEDGNDGAMSVPWSPPESFASSSTDGVLVDVWALGATVYTLLAGHSPFAVPGADNSNAEMINRISNTPLPRLGRADVPEALQLALATAMAKNPAARYPSAYAFGLALQRIQAELSLSVTPFEVMGDPIQDDSDSDEEVEATRLRGISVIDPDSSSGRTGSTGTSGEGTAPNRTTPNYTAPNQTLPEDPTMMRSTGTAPGASGGPVPQGGTAQGNAPYGYHGGAPGTPSGGSAGPAGPAAWERTREDDATSATVLRGLQDSGSTGQQNTGQHTTGQQHTGQQWTGSPHTQGGGQGSAQSGGRTKLWISVVAGALLLALGVVLVVVLNQGGTKGRDRPTDAASQSSTSGLSGGGTAKPVDPLGDGTVADVKNLSGTPDGSGKIFFSWTNPDPRDGDTYKWRTISATKQGEWVKAEQNNVRLKPTAGQPTCIQVIVVRTDGSSSTGDADSAKVCVP
ncbi:serine/threonine-protein kinase [Arthrobacter woluwensis]|uniref:non-specific serine/threonine protein kinase n=1 Tax=Arthrobacter woluwensis TaxID=156980 RepID=A0A1H4S6V1_9MICC|nr:serine/threonine-protein kinase [Arthrobacter woluwensis]SEC39956.1 Serine/threonine protein kinase [Arthrobacter woluwensis]